jgi:hypothetical protein
METPPPIPQGLPPVIQQPAKASERAGKKFPLFIIGASVIVALICGMGGVFVVAKVVKFGGVVHKATGQALYSGVGAWTRIEEFAQAQGKSNYIAEAQSTLKLLKDDLKSWRESAPSGTDFGALEKVQATAYETTDRNIKNGQNPLSYLDSQ